MGISRFVSRWARRSRRESGLKPDFDDYWDNRRARVRRRAMPWAILAAVSLIALVWQIW